MDLIFFVFHIKIGEREVGLWFVDGGKRWSVDSLLRRDSVFSGGSLGKRGFKGKGVKIRWVFLFSFVFYK